MSKRVNVDKFHQSPTKQKFWTEFTGMGMSNVAFLHIECTREVPQKIGFLYYLDYSLLFGAFSKPFCLYMEYSFAKPFLILIKPDACI